MLCDPLYNRMARKGISSDSNTHHELSLIPIRSIVCGLSTEWSRMRNVVPGHVSKDTMHNREFCGDGGRRPDVVLYCTVSILFKRRVFSSPSTVAESIPHRKFRQCKSILRKQNVVPIGFHGTGNQENIPSFPNAQLGNMLRHHSIPFPCGIGNEITFALHALYVT
jgi:hypothetical protein